MTTEIIPQIQEKWEDILRVLPAELDESARRCQAMTRARNIRNGSDLLRLILIYAMLQSLRVSALVASSMGLCDISAQALQERVHKSQDWLKYLIGCMLEELMQAPLDEIHGLVRRIKLVDGSMIARPGSEGSEWRLHVAWDPVSLQICDITSTGPEEGEGFEQVALKPGDLAIADRGYGAWRHIRVALAAAAFFLVRIPWNTLRLRTVAGQSFDLIRWLKAIPQGDGVVREVTITLADDEQRRSFRLIAGRLPKAKVAEAKAKVRKRAQKKKREPHPNTLLAAEFCIVLTNLPPEASAVTVLDLYRIRWQIEWWFRRWKSICELDVLPPRPAAIAYPVLLAKILIILILQRQLSDYDWHIWWDTVETPPALTRFVRLTYLAFQNILLPIQSILRILKEPLTFARHLRLSKRQRVSQFSHVRTLFGKLANLPSLT